MKRSYLLAVPFLAIAVSARAAQTPGAVAPKVSTTTVTTPAPKPKTPPTPPAVKPAAPPKPVAPPARPVTPPTTPSQSAKPTTPSATPAKPVKAHPKATRRAAKGTVASVDAGANKISITTGAKKTQDFTLDASARVTIDKKPGKLADVKVGEKALVAYDIATNKAVLVQVSTK